MEEREREKGSAFHFHSTYYPWTRISRFHRMDWMRFGFLCSYCCVVSPIFICTSYIEESMKGFCVCLQIKWKFLFVCVLCTCVKAWPEHTCNPFPTLIQQKGIIWSCVCGICHKIYDLKNRLDPYPLKYICWMYSIGRFSHGWNSNPLYWPKLA